MRAAILLALGASFLALWLAAPARAAAPVIVNTSSTGGQTNWLESFTVAGETGDNGEGRRVRVTLVVKHDPGRKVTGVKIDEDYGSTDEASAAPTRTVTAQQPTIPGGYDYSRVSFSYLASTSNTGIDCGFLSGTRESTRPLRIRAVLDDGAQTATSSSNIHFTAASQCTGPEDYAYLYEWSQSASSITPGTSVTFTYKGDDPDTGFTGDRDFQGVRWRLRRLSDGATTTPQTSCPENGDNASKTLTVTFPNRGRWVVEAELLDGDGCGANQNAGNWFWIGAVDVNSPASESPHITLSATRPNVGGNTTITATVDDSADAGAGGVAQDIEWDLDGNGTYESASLGDWQTGLTANQRTRTINTTGQTPGLHTVRARVGDNGAISGADNIRRTNVDTVQYLVDSPPVANPQSRATESGEPISITLTASDADNDTLTYTVPANSGPSHGTLTGSGANRTYTPSASFAGTDSFSFQVSDGFGGTDTETVTITVRPQTTVGDAVPSGRSVSIPFGSQVTDATFECSLDNGPFNPCTSSATYSDLADGSHNFRVRAVAASLTDPTPAETTFQIDGAPVAEVTGGPSGETNSPDATFTFTASEVGATTPPALTCRLDSADFRPCSSPVTYTDLPDGEHTFQVRATDAFGEQATDSRTFIVDTTAAQTTIDSAPQGRTSSTSAEISFSGSGGAVSFQCSLDGGSFSSCTSPQSLNGLGEGEHRFRVRSLDSLGNVEPTPAVATWVVDLTPPSTGIGSGPSGATSDNTPSFGFSSSDPLATFECSVDSAPFAPCSSPHTSAALDDGIHTFEVRARDEAGNADQTPASRTFTVDTTAPSVTIVSGPNGAGAGGTVSDPTPSFTFSSENGAAFECRLDSADPAAFAPCSAVWETPALSDGPHTLSVRAVDAAGNRTDPPASRSFTVDAAAPQTVITAGPSGTVRQATARFEFESPDGNSTFECALDGAAFAACTSPRDLTGLSAGSHTFQVRAIDGGGTPDPTPASRTWTVDLSAQPGPNTPPNEPGPNPGPCTYGSTQANCGNPTLTVGLAGATAGVDLKLNASSGGPALRRATFRLSRQLLLKAPARALGRGVGRLKLSGPAGGRSLLLRLPKRAARKMTLLRSGGVIVTVRGRRGFTLAVRGIPAGFTGVKLALRGRSSGLIRVAKPCRTVTARGGFIDRNRRKAPAWAFADTPCTAGAPR